MNFSLFCFRASVPLWEKRRIGELGELGELGEMGGLGNLKNHSSPSSPSSLSPPISRSTVDGRRSTQKRSPHKGDRLVRLEVYRIELATTDNIVVPLWVVFLAHLVEATGNAVTTLVKEVVFASHSRRLGIFHTLH